MDLHLHGGGSLGVWELELIARRTREHELGGRVAVSHAYGRASVLGLESYGLTPGDRADLVLVDARTPAEAVVTHPRPWR